MAGINEKALSSEATGRGLIMTTARRSSTDTGSREQMTQDESAEPAGGGRWSHRRLYCRRCRILACRGQR
jgi:hypothetical protein